MSQESGVAVKLVSLAGMVGVIGRGRQIAPVAWTIAALTQILNENGRRLTAIIQNTGTLNATIYFGNDTVGLTLLPNANLQIDADFPWTGNVWANSVGTTLEVIEVSVP